MSDSRKVLDIMYMNKLRRMAKDDSGWTLIELFLIMVIIGILCAIAIPLLHSQTQRAQAATGRSDLRNAATAMETYYSDSQAYGSAAQMTTAGVAPTVSKGTTVVIVQRTANGYCLAAIRNAAVPGTTAGLQAIAVGWLDSAAGGLQPKTATGCPTTTGFNAGWQTDTFSG